ncbi:hypothetical protein GIY23_09500 [Allosaccharopolyspora coralli]|uniref:Rieske domain-containing protein n=1 Tax=Allosaccharopolyspora coralli TaxID=2665642 RepID=A0A5Q3Q7A9_9PSEU|nr:NifU family protein [Allosaccharopolyspora coralli]QGK69720.1 hypothetical protein GIY23_09500 [Allosaccharopolyspora coralli]
MTQAKDGADAREVAGRIDELLGQFERSGDPAATERAEELVRTLVEFYGAGLGRMVCILQEEENVGGELYRELAADPLVGALLTLHDLHPESVGERVAAALDTVRPYLGSHSGDVELFGVGDDGVAHLRLTGSCDGCPSSLVTVKLAIENAIREAAPEVTEIEVEGVTGPGTSPAGPGGRPLLPLVPEQSSGPAAEPEWRDLDCVDRLAPGVLLATEVAGRPVTLCTVDDQHYAYADRCPRCTGPISAGTLDGASLRCGTCGEHYDVRLAGRGLDNVSLHLEPLPLLVDDSTVRVAVPMGVTG